jgi:phosphoribosyl 1,2-cyclic phosphodiesterase
MAGKSLLIECGVAYKKLLKALKFDLSNIEACLITHGHSDHSFAAIDLMNNGVDVYASAGTFIEIGIAENCPQWRRVNVIKDKDLLCFPDFQVLVFNTHHDAAEPCGFLIRETATDEFMLFATDTGYLEQDFRKFPVKIIAIECSFEQETVEHRLYATEEQLKESGQTRINEALAKRLLTSHFEKQAAMSYIEKFLNLSKCTEIHLLHLSSENIDKEKTRLEFEKKFGITTIIKE